MAIVTGASSGIGEATVRRLTKSGWTVVAAARRMDRLEALAAETGARAVHLDVTDPTSVAALADSVEWCNLLVNNAGGALGSEAVEGGDLDEWRRMFEVNVLGTAHVTKALLPALRRSDEASIVIVTSTAGIVTYENGGGYTAAKHAEHALASTLRLELCGEPIRVVEILPGMVQTAEFALNRFHGDAEKAAAVYDGVEGPLAADDVAECITWATSLPSHVNIDQMVVRPVAQAAQHKLHRGPLRMRRP